MNKQIINPSFNYGAGDDGESTLKQGVRLPKQSTVAGFYNAFEFWVKRLCEALSELGNPEFCDGMRAIDVDRNWFKNRIGMMMDILEYFRDHAYCLGAQVFIDSSRNWQWDASLLDWMRLEIPQLESVAHNFISPDVENMQLSALDELRIQTRMLESYLCAVADDPSINGMIINRLSSYIYVFENFLRTCYGDEIDNTDWSMDNEPKFSPRRSEAGNNQ